MLKLPKFVLPLALGVFCAAPAAASTITFSYNCNIVGPTCPSISPSIGTLTISDSLSDPNAVDVTLNLVSGDPQSFFMNYNNVGTIPSGYSFAASGTTIQLDPNSTQADGYNIGFFDLVIPKNGNISGNPFTTTLTLTNGTGGFVNLSALDFAGLTTNGTLFSAVQKTGGSSYFGSTSCTGCGFNPPPDAAPEPATMLLLGSGLFVVAYRLRRRRS